MSALRLGARGYGLYRQIRAFYNDCMVVAPRSRRLSHGRTHRGARRNSRLAPGSTGPTNIQAPSRRSRNLNLKTAYLDGELCGVNDAGLPSFAQTQAATDGERNVHLVYYAFDLQVCVKTS